MIPLHKAFKILLVILLFFSIDSDVNIHTNIHTKELYKCTARKKYEGIKKWWKERMRESYIQSHIHTWWSSLTALSHVFSFSSHENNYTSWSQKMTCYVYWGRDKLSCSVQGLAYFLKLCLGYSWARVRAHTHIFIFHKKKFHHAINKIVWF